MADFGFYDFSNGTNLLATPLSMNDSVRSLDWASSENVELYGLTGLNKMKGNVQVLDLGEGTKVLAILEYKKNRDIWLAFVYADDTQAYFCISGDINSETGYTKDSDLATYSVVKGGLDKDASYHLTTYNNGVIVSNGVDNPFIYQRNEHPSIVTCRLFEARGVYAKATHLFRGRVYAFEEKDGILYYSAVGNPAEWVTEKDGGYFAQISGSDAPLRALHNYGDSLAIHRDKSTVLLTGTSTLDFDIKPFSDKGSLSKRGIVNYDNKQLFYDEGIFALQYSSLQQIQLSSELSKNITPAFDTMLTSNLAKMVTIAYPNKKQVWFFCSDSDEDTDELNTVWIMDRRNSKKVSWCKRKALPVTCACLFADEIFTGTADGKILRENSTTTLNGSLFNGTWSSAWLKFGNLQLKSVESGMDLGFDGNASNNVTLELRFNTDTTRVKRRAISAPQRNKGIWGVSKWGQCVYRKNVSAIKRVNIPGIFKSIQVSITSTNDFIINALAFYDVVIEE